MKLKVKNIAKHNIERLGYIFVPEVVQEIDVKDKNEYIAVKASRNLEVEIVEPEIANIDIEIEPEKKKRTRKPKDGD